MQIKLNNKKRVINFHFQPKNHLVKLLAEQLNVLSFEALKFFGSIQQVSSSRWELSGILNFKVTQECVVTLKPVVSLIKTNIKRIYLDESALKKMEIEDNNAIRAEYEKLEDIINLLNIVSEELCLNTPEYPKIKNIDKERQKNIASADNQEQEKNNPFDILKNLNLTN